MRITSNYLLLCSLAIVWLSAPFLLQGSGPQIVTNDISTNLRIDGEGYFVIQNKETGKLLLTRCGGFSVDWDGFLSLQNRYRVLGLDLLSREMGPVWIGPENNMGNPYSSNDAWYAIPTLASAVRP